MTSSITSYISFHFSCFFSVQSLLICAVYSYSLYQVVNINTLSSIFLRILRVVGMNASRSRKWTALYALNNI